MIEFRNTWFESPRVSTKRTNCQQIPPSSITKDDTVKITAKIPNYTIAPKTSLYHYCSCPTIKIPASVLHLHPSDTGGYHL